MGTQWQYKPTHEKYKSGTELIEILIETRAKGGNLLLNVGPKPDGELAIEQEERLRALGEERADRGIARRVERADAGEADALARRLHARLEELGAYDVVNRSLMMVGAEGIYRETGQLDRAVLDRSVSLLRDAGDMWGLALGLLDIGIIETYNGTIWVESKPGAGSTDRPGADLGGAGDLSSVAGATGGGRSVPDPSGTGPHSTT